MNPRFLMTFINTCSTKANYQPTRSEFYAQKMIAMLFVLEIRTKTTAKHKKVDSIHPPLFCGEAFFSGNPCKSTSNSEFLLDLFWRDQNLWTNRRWLFFLQRKQKRHQPKQASSEVVHHSWKSIKFLFFPAPPPKKRKNGNEKTHLSFDHQEKHLDSLQSCVAPSLLPSVLLLGYHSPSIIQIVGPPVTGMNVFVANFVEPISPVVLPGHTRCKWGQIRIPDVGFRIKPNFATKIK